VKYVDGKLVRLDGKKEKYTMEQKKDFFAELKYICNMRKYKPGCAAKQYKKKFGVYPNHPSIKYVEMKEPTKATSNWVKSQMIRWVKRRNK